jgi:hypothetical protein
MHQLVVHITDLVALANLVVSVITVVAGTATIVAGCETHRTATITLGIVSGTAPAKKPDPRLYLYHPTRVQERTRPV